MLIGFVVHFGFVAVALLLYFLYSHHTMHIKHGRFVHCFVIYTTMVGVCYTMYVFVLPLLWSFVHSIFFYASAFLLFFPSSLQFQLHHKSCIFSISGFRYYLHAKFRNLKCSLSKRCISPFATFNMWFNALKSNLFYEFCVHAMRSYILFFSKQIFLDFFSSFPVLNKSNAHKQLKHTEIKNNNLQCLCEVYKISD